MTCSPASRQSLCSSDRVLTTLPQVTSYHCASAAKRVGIVRSAFAALWVEQRPVRRTGTRGGGRGDHAAGVGGLAVSHQGQRRAAFGSDGGAWFDLTSKGGPDQPSFLDGGGPAAVPRGQ